MQVSRRAAPMVAIGLLLSMSATAAEPKLMSSTPADGATLSSAPTEVVLNFAGPVALTGVAVVQSNGAAHAIESLPDGRAAHLVVKVPKLKRGKYRIEWYALSDSTHVTTGEFGFEIK